MLRRILFSCLLLLAAATASADGAVVEIWTSEQLTALRDNVNIGTDNYSGKTVRLMTNLNLIGWTAIGTIDDEAHSFCGTFDGQGYTIDISVNSSATVLALFGYFRGTVQHLKVTGSLTNTNTATTSSTAGIVAYNRGTISECANQATVIGTTAGGIAGENLGTISHCYNKGYVGGTGGTSHYYLGGIAGVCESGSSTTCVFASCMIEDVDAEGGIAANKKDGALFTDCFYDVTLRNGGSESTMTGSTTLTGDALKSSLGDTYWTYTPGQLPELTCFATPIVRLGDNTDNSAIISAYNEKTCTVELSGRTLYKDNSWNTLCLPFDLSVLEGSPLEGSTVKTLSSATFDAGILTLNFEDVTTIEAGKPYIIKWTGGEDFTPTFEGVTIKSAAPTDVVGTAANFHGIYAPYSTDGEDKTMLYLGADNKLYYPNADMTINAFRAYFVLKNGITAGDKADNVRAFVLNFGDESMGIADVNLTSTSQESGISIPLQREWYTLDGRRLSGKPSRAGVYINNGKQVIFK